MVSRECRPVEVVVERRSCLPLFHAGRVYGGELLKMIDVAAGVVAAKHAGGPCLTVSVE
jgi:acyl-CoA hydrolase